MLETFVFISGYLFGFQVQKNGIGIICFKNTILKKAKRLLLPCFFFGVIYYTVFYDLSKPVYEISYSIMCGTGHLWFLPMLFWCFTEIYLIERLKCHISSITITGIGRFMFIYSSTFSYE